MQDQHPVAEKNSKVNFTPEEKQKWITLIMDWEKSNESQRAYCKRQELNLHTFTYLRGKLLADKKKLPTAKFIPIKMKKEPAVDFSGLQITIENMKGLKLYMPLMIQEEKLLKLLKLVGWHHAEIT